MNEKTFVPKQYLEAYEPSSWEYLKDNYNQMLRLQESHPALESSLPCLTKYIKGIEVYGVALSMHQTCRLKMYCRINFGEDAVHTGWFYLNNPEVAQEIISLCKKLADEKILSSLRFARTNIVYSVYSPIFLLETKGRDSKFVMDVSVDFDRERLGQKDSDMMNVKKELESDYGQSLEAFVERRKKRNVEDWLCLLSWKAAQK